MILVTLGFTSEEISKEVVMSASALRAELSRKIYNKLGVWNFKS